MANYAVGILIVLIILVLAVWAHGGSRLLIAGLVVVCAAALAHAVTDGDDGPVGAADRPKAVSGVKFKLRDILRNAKSGAKSAMSLAAVGATAGFGGDTIVEVLGLVLESTVWLAEIASVFLTNTADYGVTLRQIWSLDFSRGIEGLHSDMARIVADAGGPTSEVFGQVRRVYEGTIEWLISMLGSVISACIPDDAGVAGWALTELGIIAVRVAPTTLWWTIDAIYRSLPQSVRDILQNPGGLESMAVYAIKTLETYVLNGGDDRWWQTAAKSLTRNTAITSIAFGTLLLQPILMMPVAITIFLGGQLINALYTVGLGNQQISAVLHSLYEKKVPIPGVGDMTAVEAMVMFVRKITLLTFAGMYIMSDNSIAAADGPPAGFTPPPALVGYVQKGEKAKPPVGVGKTTDVLANALDAVANTTPSG